MSFHLLRVALPAGASCINPFLLCSVSFQNPTTTNRLSTQITSPATATSNTFSRPYFTHFTTFQLQPFLETNEFMSTIQNLKTFGKPDPSFRQPLATAVDNNTDSLIVACLSRRRLSAWVSANNLLASYGRLALFRQAATELLVSHG